MRLRKAVEGYLLDITTSFSLRTVELYRSDLGVFLRFMNDPELEEITPIQLSKFMSYLRTEYKGHRYGGEDALYQLFSMLHFIDCTLLDGLMGFL
ncbi:MAG TPA: site-specific integrase [Anaerolineaceae bacterium]|nr:site-specific integrase [Anaerolineaceae bacterium]